MRHRGDVRRSRRCQILVVASGCVLSGCGSGGQVRTVRSPTNEVETGSTSTLPLCPPELPPGQTCDPNAIEANRAQLRAQIARHWPPTATTYLTRDQAVKVAENETPGSRGVTVHARFMTYRQSADLVGGAPNVFVDPNTRVWVVTVYAQPSGSVWHPPPVPSGAYEGPPSSYTVVMDAVNGGTIDTCAPCQRRLSSG